MVRVGDRVRGRSKKATFILLLTMLAVVGVACGDKDGSTGVGNGEEAGQSSAPSTPEAVAEAVIAAMKASDLAGVQKHMTANNTKRFESMPADARDAFLAPDGKFLKSWRGDALRAFDGKLKGTRYRHFVGTESDRYVADVLFHDMSATEVAVIRLIRENGEWRFDDINSPERANWMLGRESFEESKEAY